MAFHLLLAAFLASAATALVTHRSPTNASFDRVEVVVYAESRCVHSQSFIVSPLKKTMEAEGVADIVDFAYYPFGNAYFKTEQCDGPPNAYSSSTSDCFNTKCGPGSEQSNECFTGEIVCQHGELECQLNRLLACGVKEGNYAILKYLDFAVCVENTWNGAEPFDLIKKCSSSSNFSETAIRDCYTGNESMELMKTFAAKTPPHDEVPWVVVDGTPLNNSYTLLGAICKSYKGPLPKGCPNSNSTAESDQ